MEIRTTAACTSPSEITTTPPVYPFYTRSMHYSSSSSSSSSSLTSINDSYHLHRGSGQFMFKIHRSSIGEELESEDSEDVKNIFKAGNVLNLLDNPHSQNGYMLQNRKGSWDERQVHKQKNQSSYSLQQQLQQQFQQLKIQQMQQQIDQQILTIQQQQQQINEQKQLLQQKEAKQLEIEQQQQKQQQHAVRCHRTPSNSNCNSPDIIITASQTNNTNEQKHLLQKHSLHPLLENRENFLAVDVKCPPKKYMLKLMQNGNSEKLEDPCKFGQLTRCYSMGSSELNSFFKRQQGKRRETIQVPGDSNSKKVSPFLLVGAGERKGSLNEGRPLGENRQPTAKRQYLTDIASSFTYSASSNSAIDLTCKRKRSFDNRLLSCNNNSSNYDSNDDEDYNYHSQRGNSNPESFSILKSVLMSNGPLLLPPSHMHDSDDELTSEVENRLRSHTLSVCELQGFRNVNTGYSISPPAASPDNRKVTLAKKNLAPVQRFVTERLKEISRFASRQPDFNQLPLSDRRALLCRSGPRLLLLYMAEMNFKFATTPIWESSSHLATVLSADVPELPELKLIGSLKPDAADREVPTQRFVDTVQSFISKCQSQSITADEYFYMRLIVLFHIGCEPLIRMQQVSQQHKEAQQDLQDLSTHKFPHDRLRYSKLLLTLYTLFGINCTLIESLFYSPSDESRTMSEYLCDELECIVSSTAIINNINGMNSINNINNSINNINNININNNVNNNMNSSNDANCCVSMEMNDRGSIGTLPVEKFFADCIEPPVEHSTAN